MAKKKVPKRGRPTLPNARRHLIGLRANPVELQRWAGLANKAGLSLSEWIRKRLDGLV